MSAIPQFEASALEQEVAQLIVESLNLEETDPHRIDPDAPLFREGLGLDSIDALELALAVSSKYGFKLQSDDKNNKAVFRSLRSLTQHIHAHRTQ